jgi:predicted HAD superfamily Cof-like phosphohydrolase|tara:strand:+ start:535 stop:948 length:414 start_codon:yes stop_codon:yes gene_type:complete
MTNFEKVKIFMESFGQEVKHKPAVPDIDIIELRLNLINEEFIELVNAAQESREEDENVSQKDKLIDVADALADLLYVVYGAGHAFGLDLDECFTEVHESNMSKFDKGKPIYREDGKVLKSDTYIPPNLGEILFPKGE